MQVNLPAPGQWKINVAGAFPLDQSKRKQEGVVNYEKMCHLQDKPEQLFS